MPIACAGDDCAGTVELVSVAGSSVKSGRLLGSSDFELSDGQQGAAKVKLKRFAAKLLRKGKLRKAQVRLTYADGESSSKILRLRKR